MPRRKTPKKNKKENEKNNVARVFGGHSEKRFGISLVFMMAGLAFSLFLLLLTMIGVQNEKVAAFSPPATFGSDGKSLESQRSSILDDPGLDYKLSVPPQMGEWLYKIGHVKSETDDSLSDQYMNLFVPQTQTSISNNFDEITRTILTVRQFTEKEWKQLESGCRKGNQFYCEAAGTKIGEKDGTIYAYTKPDGCPDSLKSKCALADKIAESFKMK